MRNVTMGIKIGKLLIYAGGILMVSVGIVLCKKCNLGISPVSSIPLIMESIIPFTFGNLTMLFHLINTILQLILEHRKIAVRTILQIPLAFCFGMVIDWIQGFIIIDDSKLICQLMALVLSVFFTGFGMLCMISVNLIQNPPDGLVCVLSRKLNRELGQIKIYYDITCVIISSIIGTIVIGKPRGLGIATIVSAIFVGKTVIWLKKGFYLLWNQYLKKY